MRTAKHFIVIEGGIKWDEQDSKIIQLLIEGKTAKQIGEALYKSNRTIENYFYRMMKLLGARSKYELCIMALQMGVVDYKPPEKKKRPPAIYNNKTPFGIAEN